MVEKIDEWWEIWEDGWMIDLVMNNIHVNLLEWCDSTDGIKKGMSDWMHESMESRVGAMSLSLQIAHPAKGVPK